MPGTHLGHARYSPSAIGHARYSPSAIRDVQYSRMPSAHAEREKRCPVFTHRARCRCDVRFDIGVAVATDCLCKAGMVGSYNSVSSQIKHIYQPFQYILNHPRACAHLISQCSVLHTALVPFYARARYWHGVWCYAMSYVLFSTDTA